MRHAARRARRRPRTSGPPVVLLVGVLLAAVVVGVAAVVVNVVGVEEDPPRYTEASTPNRPVPAGLGADASPRGLAMLRTWDAERARAWSDGDAEALTALYTPGSSAGRRDVAMLRAYADRGLRVEDLRTQVLSARLRSRGPRHRVLEVTDRVAGGRVTGRAGSTYLPRDAASRHVLTWRRLDGRWLLDRVTPA